MAIVKTDDQHYINIANAIRTKTGRTDTFTPGEMDDAILQISGGGVENLSWNQCPQLVKDYLAYIADHPYSDNDHTYTHILDFAPSTADQANTKPVGKEIDGIIFYDNEPLVATPFSTTNKAGTLTALDRLRWYNTTCAAASGNPYTRGYNCRDLGGWACDGGKIKYGMIVRSGEINPTDKALMVDKIGIKTEINLLPTSVQAANNSPWGIDYVANPTDIDFMYNISGSVKDQWKLYLQTAFNSVSHNKPIIFHCGVGADKTGTMSAMLMGILGCSLSDIDTDYELTVFADYTTWRNRTYEAWWRYLDAIKAVPLANGLTDSFQNHCVSFALSLGITAQEINAFRAACIDGTPETITPSISTFTVTKTLTNANIDNADTTTTQNQQYEANIRAATGYVIDSVSVTMGGVDVTNRVFTGDVTVLRHFVRNNLIGCTTDSAKNNVVDGNGYVAEITANTGYTLNGATVSITMGGENVSNYYSDGKIAIPSVTGDLVITVTAVATAPSYTNLADPSSENWLQNKRLGANGVDIRDADGATVTNYIPCQSGNVVRVYGLGALNQYIMWICNSDKSNFSAGIPSNDADYYAYNSTTGVVTITVRSGGTTNKYLRITGVLSGASEDVIITVNEEIA